MNTGRVAITGMGVISALGKNSSEFWQALREGQSGIRPIETVDCTQVRFKNGAEVRGFAPQNYFEGKRIEFLDRFAQFGLIAAQEAVADAGIEWTQDLREYTTIVTGSCIGGKISEDQAFFELYRLQSNRINPLTIPRVMANAAASHIAMEFGITGPALTFSTACASASHAIGQAFWMVRHGLANLALTGGSEATFSPFHLKAWEAIRAVSSDTCRPFSKNRSGMILGEGGAMMVLEPLETALDRGAHIYGEIIGFGMSSDAHHLTQPSSEGMARAMRAALTDSRLQPEQIGYINAHGTGTIANDSCEVAAIRAAFGKQADNLAISSTKSLHGHTLGAAGAIEASATVLALKYGFLPPTANYLEPDPQCDLDVIPNTARETEVEYALSNSFAFGGTNAVLAFRRWGETSA